MDKRKAVIFFILRFALVYAVLSYGYHRYLSSYGPDTPDGITGMVTRHTIAAGKWLGMPVSSRPHPDEASYQLLYNGKYVARIVEGCNSVAVIILFWAFLVAFKGKPLTTLFYGIAGSMDIYLFNLFRILVLTYAVYHFPERTEILHKVIFPGLIYGFTFLLWVIWVKKFAIDG